MADRTVAAIRAYLGGFGSVPHRGTRRDDLMPGLRIVPFKRRTAIAFTIDDGARCAFFASSTAVKIMSRYCARRMIELCQ